MGLRALSNGKEIYAFKYNKKDWFANKQNIDFKSSITMPCCGAKASLKTSSLGTQFFSHVKDKCATAPESKEHIFLKFEVCRIATLIGWKAQTEVMLRIENKSLEEEVILNRDYIIADTLLSKNDKTIAIEIQMSNQSEEITKQRSEHYKKLGIFVVWIMKRKTTKIVKNDYYQVYLVEFDRYRKNSVEIYDDFTYSLLNAFIRKKLKDTLAKPFKKTKRFNLNRFTNMNEDCVEFTSIHEIDLINELSWNVVGDIDYLPGKIFRDTDDLVHKVDFYISNGFESVKFTEDFVVKGNPSRNRENLKYLRKKIDKSGKKNKCVEQPLITSESGETTTANFWDKVTLLNPSKL